MEKNNKKKGFTLIELLAVIVVLAIVAVLGASIILPALANARKDAFVTESNNFIEAASNAVNMIQVGSIPKKEYEDAGAKYDTDAKKYCFTLESLRELGLFDKKDITGYNGKVEVDVSNKLHQFTTTFSNKDYYVKTVIGSVKEDNVVEYKTGENFSNTTGLSDSCS